MKKINKILVSIVIGGIIIYFIFFFQIEQSKYKEIDCHGEPVLVLKNPSNLFPIYAMEYNKRLKLNFKMIDSVANIETNAKVKNKIITFREKLNQENIRYQDLLKAKYESFTRFPCDKKAKKDFDDFLNKMNENAFEIEKIRINIYKIKKEAENINTDTKTEIIRTITILNTDNKWNNAYITSISVNGTNVKWNPIDASERTITYKTFIGNEDTIKIKNSNRNIFTCNRTDNNSIVIK